jgi:hypothetical protein
VPSGERRSPLPERRIRGGAARTWGEFFQQVGLTEVILLVLAALLGWFLESRDLYGYGAMLAVLGSLSLALGIFGLIVPASRPRLTERGAFPAVEAQEEGETPHGFLQKYHFTLLTACAGVIAILIGSLIQLFAV